MTKNKLLVFVASALTVFFTFASANETVTNDEQAQPAYTGQFNVFDPAAWFGAFNQPAATVENGFNAAHPAAWMQFIDPETHMQTHRQFANPAFYSQFMQPGFYVQFMNPQNWMAWMNPASYQKMWDPAVMNHWMNPASYMHVMDPSMYTEMMNPAAYAALAQPILPTVKGESAN